MKIEEKLNPLVNKEFIYNGEKIIIKSWKIVNTFIMILTDGKTITKLHSELDNFIDGLELTNNKLPFIPKKENQSIKTIELKKTKTHETLEKSLINMIAKVEKDPKYISQATALCNLSNSIINLEKQQVNLLKVTNQL